MGMQGQGPPDRGHQAVAAPLCEDWRWLSWDRPCGDLRLAGDRQPCPMQGGGTWYAQVLALRGHGMEARIPAGCLPKKGRPGGASGKSTCTARRTRLPLAPRGAVPSVATCRETRALCTGGGVPGRHWVGAQGKGGHQEPGREARGSWRGPGLPSTVQLPRPEASPGDQSSWLTAGPTPLSKTWGAS